VTWFSTHPIQSSLSVSSILLLSMCFQKYSELINIQGTWVRIFSWLFVHGQATRARTPLNSTVKHYKLAIQVSFLVHLLSIYSNWGGLFSFNNHDNNPRYIPLQNKGWSQVYGCHLSSKHAFTKGARWFPCSLCGHGDATTREPVISEWQCHRDARHGILFTSPPVSEEVDILLFMNYKNHPILSAQLKNVNPWATY
jgi:hypothetical protein